MCKELTHYSVLGAEAPEALIHHRAGCYVDGTFGMGGHTRRILQALDDNGRLFAFDRDPRAVRIAQSIDDPRFQMIHSPFSKMKEALAALGIEKVDGILLDIGVSSPQIDDPARGFSFRESGPLDMRMDTSSGLTARQWLIEHTESEIREAIATFGEERFARPIAKAIKEALAADAQALQTTQALANLVSKIVPKNPRDAKQHPATRTFQGIRIAVNGELDELATALESAGSILAPQGRLVVISFHSLEDRMVKRFFERTAHPERGIDPRLPIMTADLPPPLFEQIERIKPSAAECEENPRSRSAVMRVGTRTAHPWVSE